MLRVILFFALLFATIAYAWLRGGGMERAAAILLIAASFASFGVLAFGTNHYQRLQLGLCLVDAGLAASVGALAMVSRRFWPLTMTALLLVELLMHLGMAIEVNIGRWAYQTAVKLWSYPILALLVSATSLHQRRLRLHGTDPSWPPSLSRWLVLKHLGWLAL